MGRSGGKNSARSRSIILGGSLAKISRNEVFKNKEDLLKEIEKGNLSMNLLRSHRDKTLTLREIKESDVFEFVFNQEKRRLEEVLELPEFYFAGDKKEILSDFKKRLALFLKENLDKSNDSDFIDVFFDFENNAHLTSKVLINYLNENPDQTERLFYQVLNKSIQKSRPKESYLKSLALYLGPRLAFYEIEKTAAFDKVDIFLKNGLKKEGVDKTIEASNISNFIETSIVFGKAGRKPLNQEYIERTIKERAARIITQRSLLYIAGEEIYIDKPLPYLAKKIQKDPKKSAERFQDIIDREKTTDLFEDWDLEKTFKEASHSRIEEAFNIAGLQIIFRERETVSETFTQLVGKKEKGE